MPGMLQSASATAGGSKMEKQARSQPTVCQLASRQPPRLPLAQFRRSSVVVVRARPLVVGGCGRGSLSSGAAVASAAQPPRPGRPRPAAAPASALGRSAAPPRRTILFPVLHQAWPALYGRTRLLPYYPRSLGRYSPRNYFLKDVFISKKGRLVCGPKTDDGYTHSPKVASKNRARGAIVHEEKKAQLSASYQVRRMHGKL
jgi:hypothetical protein